MSKNILYNIYILYSEQLQLKKVNLLAVLHQYNLYKQINKYSVSIDKIDYEMINSSSECQYITNCCMVSKV